MKFRIVYKEHHISLATEEVESASGQYTYRRVPWWCDPLNKRGTGTEYLHDLPNGCAEIHTETYDSATQPNAVVDLSMRDECILELVNYRDKIVESDGVNHPNVVIRVTKSIVGPVTAEEKFVLQWGKFSAVRKVNRDSRPNLEQLQCSQIANELHHEAKASEQKYLEQQQAKLRLNKEREHVLEKLQ